MPKTAPAPARIINGISTRINNIFTSSSFLLPAALCLLLLILDSGNRSAMAQVRIREFVDDDQPADHLSTTSTKKPVQLPLPPAFLDTTPASKKREEKGGNAVAVTAAPIEQQKREQLPEDRAEEAGHASNDAASDSSSVVGVKNNAVPVPAATDDEQKEGAEDGNGKNGGGAGDNVNGQSAGTKNQTAGEEEERANTEQQAGNNNIGENSNPSSMPPSQLAGTTESNSNRLKLPVEPEGPLIQPSPSGGSGGAGSSNNNNNTDCADTHGNCPFWVRNGFCHNQFYTPETRARYCRSSCGLC